MTEREPDNLETLAGLIEEILHEMARVAVAAIHTIPPADQSCKLCVGRGS